jgi:hypothetical protein
MLYRNITGYKNAGVFPWSVSRRQNPDFILITVYVKRTSVFHYWVKMSVSQFTGKYRICAHDQALSLDNKTGFAFGIHISTRLGSFLSLLTITRLIVAYSTVHQKLMNGQLAKVTQLHLIRPGGRCGM